MAPQSTLIGETITKVVLWFKFIGTPWIIRVARKWEPDRTHFQRKERLYHVAYPVCALFPHLSKGNNSGVCLRVLVKIELIHTQHSAPCLVCTCWLLLWVLHRIASPSLGGHVLCVTFAHLCLLCSQALLSAHDTVAQKDFEPLLPPLPDNIPESEEAMRIVCLVKNQQPLVRKSFYLFI